MSDELLYALAYCMTSLKMLVLAHCTIAIALVVIAINSLLRWFDDA